MLPISFFQVGVLPALVLVLPVRWLVGGTAVVVVDMLAFSSESAGVPGVGMVAFLATFCKDRGTLIPSVFIDDEAAAGRLLFAHVLPVKGIARFEPRHQGP